MGRAVFTYKLTVVYWYRVIIQIAFSKTRSVFRRPQVQFIIIYCSTKGYKTVAARGGHFVWRDVQSSYLLLTTVQTILHHLCLPVYGHLAHVHMAFLVLIQSEVYLILQPKVRISQGRIILYSA